MVREFISYNGPNEFLLHLPTRSSYPGNECFQHGGHPVARNEVNGEKKKDLFPHLFGRHGDKTMKRTHRTAITQKRSPS